MAGCINNSANKNAVEAEGRMQMNNKFTMKRQ